ncbi:MAG: MFS transporter [Pseudomonadota bacterium]
MHWKNHPGGALTALLILHLLAHIDRNMLLGFSPQIIADLHLNQAQYGFLVGAVWVLSFGFMAIFMGTLADRYSRPRILACGLLIWSVCTWLSGYAQGFGQMVAARFFVASGEAALVPVATALLSELFSERRRGSAIGIFFMGIPLGIGCSFLLAGSLGAASGWRNTFFALGVTGVLLALPLVLLKDDRKGATAPRGEPFARQIGAVLATVRRIAALRNIIIGFVLIHMVFASLAFSQLWLVSERGFDASGIALRIGALQLVFGTLGALAGGVLGDRAARRLPGGHAGFMVLLVALCGPLMLAYRFSAPGSPLFYAGMCAGSFLPMAVYGPANGSIMALAPASMRATMTGFTMMTINVVAIALGNLAVGAASDYLNKAGTAAPLTKVLLTCDMLAILSILFFHLAARAAKAPAHFTPEPA